MWQKVKRAEYFHKALYTHLPHGCGKDWIYSLIFENNGGRIEVREHNLLLCDITEENPKTY